MLYSHILLIITIIITIIIIITFLLASILCQFGEDHTDSIAKLVEFSALYVIQQGQFAILSGIINPQRVLVAKGRKQTAQIVRAELNVELRQVSRNIGKHSERAGTRL